MPCARQSCAMPAASSFHAQEVKSELFSGSSCPLLLVRFVWSVGPNCSLSLRCNARLGHQCFERLTSRAGVARIGWLDFECAQFGGTCRSYRSPPTRDEATPITQLDFSLHSLEAGAWAPAGVASQERSDGRSLCPLLFWRWLRSSFPRSTRFSILSVREKNWKRGGVAFFRAGAVDRCAP